MHFDALPQDVPEKIGPVRVLIVAPVDLTGPHSGGIHTFVGDFIRLAPPDFLIEHVGVASPESTVALHRWTEQTLDGRAVMTFPVVRVDPARRHSLFPVTLRFVASMVAHRSRIPTAGRLLQFHRPATAFPFLRTAAPKIQLIHFASSQVKRGGGENRWRYVPSLLGLTEAVTFNAMDAIYAVNEAVAMEYRTRHVRHADRIAFIPNWVDDRLFHPLEDETRAQRRGKWLRSLGCDDPSTPIVLHVGRLEQVKNPFAAIEAFQLIPPSLGARLLFLGDGSLRPSLEALVAERDLRGRVHFLGSQPRQCVAELMAVADVLLVASRSETGPTSVLEALASGLPIVATPVGRIPQLVIPQLTGWIADDRSPQALAQGLTWALTADRTTLSAACVEAAQPYRAHRVLDELYRQHRELAARVEGRA